jgi:Rieske 2Fe-2S family protein
MWLCFADDPPALASHLRTVIAGRFDQPATFERYGVERLAIGAVREYEVAANWKLMIENFLECTHCAPVHPDFIRLIPSYKSGRSNLHGGDAGVELGPGIDGFTWTGQASRPPLPTLRPEDHRRFHSFTIFPNVMVVLMPDHVLMFQIFPLAHDRSRVRVEWLFDRAVVEHAASSLDDTVPLFDKINREDWVLLERTQRGMASRGFARGGVLGPSELQITAFHHFVLTNLGHASDDAR